MVKFYNPDCRARGSSDTLIRLNPDPHGPWRRFTAAKVKRMCDISVGSESAEIANYCLTVVGSSLDVLEISVKGDIPSGNQT